MEPSCIHAERLVEYLRNYKLTILPQVEHDRVARVFCRKCDRESQVTLPLLDPAKN